MTDLAGFADWLGEAAENVTAEVRKSIFKGGMNIKREAQSLAPKALRADQINMEVEDGGLTAMVETRGVGGAIMEFGTPTLPGGQPFLGPALEIEARDIEKNVGDAVAKGLRK